MHRLFSRFFFLVGVSAALVSCSLFRERTVQDIIDDLPKYDANMPVYWHYVYAGEIVGLKEIRTMGELKKALENGLDPNNRDRFYHYLNDYFMKESLKEQESRLVAIELLLKAGADPQRVSKGPTIYEEEYALHIKYGLDARKPLSYGGSIEYPLTWTDHSVTAPIAEWLLAHGADPNQHALNPVFKHLTPLSNLDYLPQWGPDFSAEGYRSVSRPPEEVEKTRKVLLKYGAKK